MNKKNFIALVSVIFMVLGCASNKSSLNNNEIEVLKERTEDAILNCQNRDEDELQTYSSLISKYGYSNPCSNELLDILNRRGYIEIDIRKKIGPDVAKVFLEYVFEENYTLFSTEYRHTKIGGINFILEYLSNHKKLPNIVSFVYVTDEDNKIRVFYKINYEFGYYSKGELTDGNHILKFY